MVTLEGRVENLTQQREHTYLLKYGNSHQDTQEEHDGGKVDLRQQIRDALGHRIVLSGIVVEDLRHRPKDTKHEQDTHKRRQMGQRLEDRYEDETTDTQPENDITLRFRKLTYISLWQILLFVEFAIELVLQDKGWYEHGDQRRDEYLGNHALRRNDTLNPKHNRRDVANGRESTSGISSNHHQACINQTIAPALHKLTQHHNHHDRGGQVVENG